MILFIYYALLRIVT